MDEAIATHGIDKLRRSGVYYIIQVGEILAKEDILHCITGDRALRYYGSSSFSRNWEVCVPDERFYEAMELFMSQENAYRLQSSLPPVKRTLLHTYPRFAPAEAGSADYMSFSIVPASEWFVYGFEESMVERSTNNVPYPVLKNFAQNLVTTQRWDGLTDLIDGMDLHLEWADSNLYLGRPSVIEQEYLRWKNERILVVDPRVKRLYEGPPASHQLEEWRYKIWRRLIRTKERRLPAIASMEIRYVTRFRRAGSVDPRYRSRTL